jgi:hypothetical protein
LWPLAHIQGPVLRRSWRKEEAADDDVSKRFGSMPEWRQFNAEMLRPSAGGRDPRLMFRQLVSAQSVVNGSDLRQRKISERDALVIGRKQNNLREHVANLADNLEPDCVLVRLPWPES